MKVKAAGAVPERHNKRADNSEREQFGPKVLPTVQIRANLTYL